MKIKKYLVISSILFTTAFVACSEFEDTVDPSPVVPSDNPAVRFAASNPAAFVIQPEDLAFSILINRDGDSGELEVPVEVVKDDAGVFIVPNTVTFPAGVSAVEFPIAIADTVKFETQMELVLQIDEAFSNPYKKEYALNHFNITVLAPCLDNKVQLNLIFDGYASETTWEIKDESGEVILEGGPYADGDESKSIDMCIVDGTYTFTVYDAYGDGLTYPDLGEVSFSANGTELFSFSGDFGKSRSETFTLAE